jgi:hypothetical protein
MFKELDPPDSSQVYERFADLDVPLRTRDVAIHTSVSDELHLNMFAIGLGLNNVALNGPNHFHSGRMRLMRLLRKHNR